MKGSKVKGWGSIFAPLREVLISKSYAKERECRGWVGRFGPVLVFESWFPSLSV